MKAKLTFDQLTGLIADDLDLSRRFTRAFTKELVQVIREGLENDGKVNLSKLGIFELKQVEAREGRDPKSGEPITIPAHRKVVFKPYKQVRKRINAPYEELEAEFIEESNAKNLQTGRQKKSAENDKTSEKRGTPTRTSTGTSDTHLSHRINEKWSQIAVVAGLATALVIIGYGGYKWLCDDTDK